MGTPLFLPQSSHWGAFSAASTPAGIVVEPHPGDPEPSPLLGNIPDAVGHATRIAQPMARLGWLEHGPGPARRGADPFVALSWEEASSLLAGELRRVVDEHGPAAIFGGSYGWASAGRFHHAQSQVHRFLGCLGGYTRSVNSYSFGASEVLLPHVLGSLGSVIGQATSWQVIERHTDLLVCFGGIPLKNATVNNGGVTRHTVRQHLRAARDRGADFILFSPVRDDLALELGAHWHALAPGSDTAVMLALAHVLVTEGLHDRDFLARCTVGYDRFAPYLLGATDGQPKSPEWAAPLCGIDADDLRLLARRMAASRTLITTTWSLQRAEFGEQPVWMALVLAALLGQIGLPGGGFGHGYGAVTDVGRQSLPVGLPHFPGRRNPVAEFIPVARIADLLLHPAEPFDYDGRTLTYPDIRLVYWAGGNPFHHHQDLNRLREAFSRPDTVVVHDPFWTSAARHADLVLPATTTLERDDIGGSRADPRLVAMKAVLAPVGAARNDYAIFREVAARLGPAIEESFSEGRSERAWLERMYEVWAEHAVGVGLDVPPFAEFWERGELELPEGPTDHVQFAAFRADPQGKRLPTPSGLIEIFSAAIDAFGYDDCPGHPVWREPEEWQGSPLAAEFPLLLIANNPVTRLHSQLDVGAYSQASKVQGREPVRMHPTDMAARGIAAGTVVRLFNRRGSCLAGAVASEDVRPGVVQLSTGAWFDPDDPTAAVTMCRHGNPNVLTRDSGTSRLAQGSTGQHALVEVARWEGELPPLRCLVPPEIVARPAAGR